MKLYITKWALIKGIIEIDADKLEYDNSGTHAYYVGRYIPSSPVHIFYAEKDITDTLEDAKIIADTMRIKKILSLQKQIEKLENKTF